MMLSLQRLSTMNIVESVKFRRSQWNSVIALKSLVLNSTTRFQSFKPASDHFVSIRNTDLSGILFIHMTDLKKRLSFTNYMREVNEMFVTENILIFVKWMPLLLDIDRWFGFCDVFEITQHLPKTKKKLSFSLLKVNNYHPFLTSVILFKSSKLATVSDFVNFVEGSTSRCFFVESFEEIEIMTFEMNFNHQLPHIKRVNGGKDCLEISIKN